MSALVYKEYSCTPDHAVRESYLLSLAQAAVDKEPFETGRVLADYVDGTLSHEEAERELLCLAVLE